MPRSIAARSSAESQIILRSRGRRSRVRTGAGRYAVHMARNGETSEQPGRQACVRLSRDRYPRVRHRPSIRGSDRVAAPREPEPAGRRPRRTRSVERGAIRFRPPLEREPSLDPGCRSRKRMPRTCLDGFANHQPRLDPPIEILDVEDARADVEIALRVRRDRNALLRAYRRPRSSDELSCAV
jgi:hypothetical protein